MPPHWMQIFYIGENYFPSALDIAFDCDSNDILGMLSKCDIKFGYNEVFKKACLKCDTEKIEILLDNDKENEIQPNRDEFCSFIEAANMKRISATYLIRKIPQLDKKIVELLVHNFKNFCSNAHIGKHLLQLVEHDNQELTRVVIDKLDQGQKNTIGKHALTKCLNENKLNR